MWQYQGIQGDNVDHLPASALNIISRDPQMLHAMLVAISLGVYFEVETMLNT